MSDKLPVYGFAGTNPCTPEQIAGNLADYLPEEAVFVIPEDISRGKKEHLGLRTVAKWLLSEYDEEDTESSTDVLDSLHDFLERGHEVYLVLLRDPDSVSDTELYALAHAQSITVLDLAQNMYELGSPVPAEPEPEPVAEEPRTRGVPRELPAEPAVEAPQEDEPQADPLPQLMTFMDIQRAFAEFVRVIVRQELDQRSQEMEMAGLVPGVNKPPVVERNLVEEAEDSPPWTDEDPPPAPVDEPRYKYTRDEQGFYRPRRPGRLKRGLEQVMLTQAELNVLRSQDKVVE